MSAHIVLFFWKICNVLFGGILKCCDEVLCFKSAHATCACGGDCLTEDLVLHVAYSEDSRNVGLGRVWCGDNVALVIKFKGGVLEDGCVGNVKVDMLFS